MTLAEQIFNTAIVQSACNDQYNIINHICIAVIEYEIRCQKTQTRFEQRVLRRKCNAVMQSTKTLAQTTQDQANEIYRIYSKNCLSGSTACKRIKLTSSTSFFVILSRMTVVRIGGCSLAKKSPYPVPAK